MRQQHSVVCPSPSPPPPPTSTPRSIYTSTSTPTSIPSAMLFATGHLGADFWSGLVAAVACRCMPLQIAVISFNLSQQQRQQQQMLPLASQPARPKIVFVCYAPRSMRIFRLFALVSIRQCEMRIKNAVSNAHRPPSHPNPCHPMRHSEPIPPPEIPDDDVSLVCQCTIVVCMRKSRLMAFYIICRLMLLFRR